MEGVSNTIPEEKKKQSRKRGRSKKKINHKNKTKEVLPANRTFCWGSVDETLRQGREIKDLMSRMDGPLGPRLVREERKK